jgi:hypothetical protein
VGDTVAGIIGKIQNVTGFLDNNHSDHREYESITIIAQTLYSVVAAGLKKRSNLSGAKRL